MRLPITYSAVIGSSMGLRSLRTLHENGDLSRVWRGVYTAGPENDIDRIQALFRLVPAESRLSGPSAAAWYGFGTPDVKNVHIVVPQGATHHKLNGVVVRESVLPIPAPIWLHGVPLLPPERVAVDLARMSKRLDALPVLDAALRSGSCSPELLAAEVELHRGLRGVLQVRELVHLADPRAECHQESQLRLIIADAGLPCPTPQVVVGWYRLDLGFEHLQIGIEYDGRTHTTRERLRSDRRRMNYLAALGWRMRYFTDRDIYDEPDGIVQTLRPLLH